MGFIRQIHNILLLSFSLYLHCGGRFIEMPPPPEETPPPLTSTQMMTKVEAGSLPATNFPTHCSPKNFGNYDYERTEVGSYAYSIQQCPGGYSKGIAFCRIRFVHGEMTANFDEGSLSEIANCNDTIDDVINQISSQNVSFELLQDLGRLQLYVENSSTISFRQTSDIIKIMENLEEFTRDSNLNILTDGSLRNIVTILSQLSQAYVTNENPSNRFGKARANEVETLQQSTSELIPSLCLLSQFDAGQSLWKMSTENFVIEAENHRSEKSQSIIYEPQISNQDYDNSSSTVSLVVPARVINDAKIGITNKNEGTETTENVRTVFIYYKDDRLFPSKQMARNILSVNVGLNDSANMNLNEPILIKHKNIEKRQGRQPIPGTKLLIHETTFECVFWNFNTTQWSSEGCLLSIEDGLPVCSCSHLTNFALLIVSKDAPANFTLEIFSLIGCCISIVALFITAVVIVCYRELRKHRPGKILFHLCCNLCISYVVFASGVSNAIENPAGCTAVTFLLHYFLLVSWTWMGAYSYEMYIEVVKVFETYQSHFLLKASVVCYCVPAIIALLTMGLSGGFSVPSGKIGLEDNYHPENVCWLHTNGLYFGFLLPVGIILLANIVVFLKVIYKIKHQQIKNPGSCQTKKRNKDLFLIATTATFTMGLTWTFGFFLIFTRNDFIYNVLGWLFAISSSLQGLGIFSLTIMRREDLRRNWWNSVRSYFGYGSYSLPQNISLASSSAQKLSSARTSRTSLIRQSTVQKSLSYENDRL